MFRLVLFLNFAFMTRKHFIVHYNLLIGKDMWTCHLPFVIGFCWSCHICDENFTLIWHFLCQNVYGMTDGEDWRGEGIYISVQFTSQYHSALKFVKVTLIPSKTISPMIFEFFSKWVVLSALKFTGKDCSEGKMINQFCLWNILGGLLCHSKMPSIYIIYVVP